MLGWFLDLLGLLYHSTVDRKGIFQVQYYRPPTSWLTKQFVQLNSVFCDLFTYLNTPYLDLVHGCSDNGGPTVISYFQCQSCQICQLSQLIEWQLAKSKIILTDHFRASGQAVKVAYCHNCVGAVNSGKIQQVFANIAE